MTRRVVGVLTLLVVSALLAGFFAGRAYAKGESKRVNVLKSYGTFKGTLMDHLLYEDKEGYLYAIDPSDGTVTYIVIRTGK